MEPKHTPPGIAERGFLNVKDVQEYLGLSREGMHRFFERTGIQPHTLKVGRCMYYLKADVDRGLEVKAKETISKSGPQKESSGQR